MNQKSEATSYLPSVRSILAVLISAFITATAFPDFDLWLLGWVGLIPLLISLNFESTKISRGFLLGWIWGFFFLVFTSSWITYAPIHYGGIPFVVAYLLLFLAALIGSILFGILGVFYGLVVRRFGIHALFVAPVIWVSIEFLRIWITGNNWNAIGYSQAFNGLVYFSSIGGVYLVGFIVVLINSIAAWAIIQLISRKGFFLPSEFNERYLAELSARSRIWLGTGLVFVSVATLGGINWLFDLRDAKSPFTGFGSKDFVVAVQPNVPMDGLNYTDWGPLREEQTRMAEKALENPDFEIEAQRQAEFDTKGENAGKRAAFYRGLMEETLESGNRLVILPESPMNYQYGTDSDFRNFIGEFARRNNTSVLFNSAERDPTREDGLFNSAVMIDKNGKKIAQYDKMYLLPFGETVPLPDILAQYVPPMVGDFSVGEEYDIVPVGDSKAGVLICFETHFSSPARELVKRDADMLIEMTNDGYFGPTPVLRQHLANAVFRAVETNRPLIRVTNVGITGYINESGEVLDSPESYKTAVRIWNVGKSNRAHSIYVRLGEWFSLLCTILTLGLILFCTFSKREELSV